MTILIPNDKLCYLATPYTKYEPGIERAFTDAARLAGHLLRSGLRVFSPIVHGHPIAIIGKIDPRDLTIWLPFNTLMVKAADVLIVAHLPGWDASTGVAEEIEAFGASGRPIYDLNPNTLLMIRRGAPLAHAKDDPREQAGESE